MTATVLAATWVYGLLVYPHDPRGLVPAAFARIPVEALVAAALVLTVPGAVRRWVVAAGGALLSVLALLTILDLGFVATLDRPFDVVMDWGFFANAMDFLQATRSPVAAFGIAVGALALAAGVVVLTTWATMRLSHLLVRHRGGSARLVAALALVWTAGALSGVEAAPGVPLAARSAASLAYDRTVQAQASVNDRRSYSRELAVDRFQDTSEERLLTALQGKDVVVALVESYGRTAVEDRRIGTGVAAVLDEGTSRLGAAGFRARSAWLTSPTAGGGSWLAHATFLSGTWVDNQQRYRSLVASDQMTLPKAFQRAGWRTVAVLPAVSSAWPEGEFYGYDTIYTAPDLGYRGPKFGWATMPDQYVLAALQRVEFGPRKRGPVMVDTTLVSSHWPWTPLPRLVDWAAVGDGSGFGPMAAIGAPSTGGRPDLDRLRAAYGRSIQYSLSALVSFVQTFGTDDTVVVFLGDHQPAPLITGVSASRDVPVTVVARDPAVLEAISGWRWHDGLKPGPRAPVWRMDQFRDKFLAAFGRGAS